MALVWPDKDPEEVLDYPVSFKDWLVEGCDIDGVSNPPTVVQEGTSTPNGLTDLIVDNVFTAGKQIVTWLSAGTAGDSYLFKITADDTGTPVRTVVRRVKIKVKEK
jgi:hypothetical protein